MNKKTINIIALFLTLLMLPASWGLIVYHHVCNHGERHEISFFTETECHQSNDSACCPDDIDHIYHDDLEIHDLCANFIKYVSIESEFTGSSKFKNKLSSLLLTYRTKQINARDENIKSKTFTYCNNIDPKPPIYNISYLLRLSLHKNADDPAPISLS